MSNCWPKLVVVAFVSVFVFISSAWAVVPTVDQPVAIIRVLDKVTARVAEVKLPVEKPYDFGTLSIVAHTCRMTPPEETPEAAVFLDVTETKPGVTAMKVFSGWMFASSPALSAMEHPVYDIWLVGCAAAS